MDASLTARRFSLCLLGILWSWSSLSAPGSSEQHVPDRVVVVLGPSHSVLPERISGPEPWASGSAELDRLLERIGARAMRRVARSGGATPRVRHRHTACLATRYVNTR